jgi:hypothetical protein
MSSASDRWTTQPRHMQVWREQKRGTQPETDRLAMLEMLAHWLDDAFRVPIFGTRLGLDAIIGLVPGVGDAITSIASLFIIHAASKYGVPRVTLVRMGLNVAIDYFVGSIPILGDMFDVYWKSNLKNVELLRRYLYTAPENQRRHRWGDRLFVGLVLLAVIGIIVTSVWITFAILVWIAHALFGAAS